MGPGGGANMMFHVGHGDMGRVRITENDHAEGIADQEEGDAGFVEQSGEGIIVRGEGGDRLLTFQGADDGGCDAGSIHGREDCVGPGGGQGKSIRQRLLDTRMRGRELPCAARSERGIGAREGSDWIRNRDRKGAVMDLIQRCCRNSDGWIVH